MAAVIVHSDFGAQEKKTFHCFQGQDGEHMYTHGWFMSMYGKTHDNILK